MSFPLPISDFTARGEPRKEDGCGEGHWNVTKNEWQNDEGRIMAEKEISIILPPSFCQPIANSNTVRFRCARGLWQILSGAGCRGDAQMGVELFVVPPLGGLSGFFRTKTA